MELGWIKLHRKLALKGYYKKSAYVHLWIHLLLRANRQQEEFMWDGGITAVKEGQLLTGRKSLSQQTGISETTIERILDLLEKEGQIGQQKTTKNRLITILNWKSYQSVDNKRTTDGQQADTNKNTKKEEKDTAPSADGRIPLVIDLFKDINPTYKKWFGNTSQRKAVANLLERYGFEQLQKVIALLLKTNKIQYLPTITTPYQLEEKWASLEAGLTKEKNKIKSSYTGIA